MDAESPPPPAPPNAPIEKLGLENPIAGEMVSDAIADQPVMSDQSQSLESAPDGGSDTLPEGGSVGVDEEEELRDAIERDLCKLTIEQAEIEWGQRRLEAVDGIEEEKNAEPWRTDDVDANVDDSVEDEQQEDEPEGGALGDAANNLGIYNQSYNRRSFYPSRPDAENCAFYVKFGSCKFGPQCKFNHPPRRNDQGIKEKANYKAENSGRAGQIECKFYLSASGCKYGKDCKYSHGSPKSLTPHTPDLNFLGLPIRPGEKECPYYMRTGSCKYGSNCRFHHPDPTSSAGGDSSGYGNGGTVPSQLVSSPSASSWSSPRAFNKAPPFVSEMFSMPHAAPFSNPERKGYQASSSEKTLPVPPAFTMSNSIEMQQHFSSPVAEDCYPERPGEPECSFYMKTGDCKFKYNCKFHHPKNHTSKPKPNQHSLNHKGLPLRPDQPVCTHYHRYGICKFGPACKYDHPSQFAVLQARPF
ncbi:zinc finger CCCH domain-containing protein 43-like [Andrographis paniculata]|uniref:zinc finger CCCH domain-containing protein 43-like n=1 Tax=Andrographis paniculata TaxID=175694 RepID=UPI0021E8D6AF|nr:zinc finger CCCH domain-containing protein 43-like [Andrographis paniculata]